jgi:hypothetical protein
MRTKRTMIGGIVAAAMLTSSCASAGASRDERSYQAGYHSTLALTEVRAGGSPAASCRNALVTAEIDRRLNGDSNPYNANDFIQGCMDAIHANGD